MYVAPIHELGLGIKTKNHCYGSGFRCIMGIFTLMPFEFI